MAVLLRVAAVLGLVVSGLSTAPVRAAVPVEEVVSPGGIKAYLLHEPSIPFLAMSLHFKGGAALDPEGKAGLAYMVSGLLDEGAGPYDSQAFRRELDDNAIRLSFDAGRDGFTGELKALTENRAHAFDLLRLALTEPRFDEEPVERIRSQILANLARRSEDPQAVAGETWFARAFPDHPYGTPVRGTPETVAAIAVDDLQGFVAERLAQDALTIGVAGDITAEELGPALDEIFGALPRAAAPASVAEAEPQTDVMAVVRKAVPQSAVLFGHGGVAREDPDFYAAYVANHILGGGGFTSRLTDEIREQRGLVYSVYSYLATFDEAPLWMGGLATSNEQVTQALELVREQVARMAAGEVSEQELADAKRYLTGSFPLRLTSNDAIAGMLVGMQLNDLGIDYIERRNDYVEAVSLDDLKRVAARLFHPERLSVVVVGDPSGLEG